MENNTSKNIALFFVFMAIYVVAIHFIVEIITYLAKIDS